MTEAAGRRRCEPMAELLARSSVSRHMGTAPAGRGHGWQTTPVGFEPTRGDPIGLAGRRLNHSAKVSSAHGQSPRRFCRMGGKLASQATEAVPRAALLCRGRLAAAERGRASPHGLDDLSTEQDECGE